EMLILNHSLGELRCRDYFYLLLQQSLFLFDNEFRNRKPLEHSLSRIAQLMDLIENPHCPDREEDFVKRAGEVECEIKEKLPGIAPGACYVRGDV
ncbi:MAG: hypothetical protein M0T69_08210, partial [Deltaproteobacteria bacterium]|nr:hypothetical protein [Deltaproteobacteria bacterium]